MDSIIVTGLKVEVFPILFLAKDRLIFSQAYLVYLISFITHINIRKQRQVLINTKTKGFKPRKLKYQCRKR